MEDKIKALRAEANTLEQELTLRKAYKKMRAISRAEWEVRNALDFPEELQPLWQAVHDAQRTIAVRLGHDARVDTLVACGMDRGRAEIGNLTTDEETAYSLATWLFGLYGRFSGTGHFAATDHMEACLEHCPLGVEYWKEGNHDT